MTPSPRSLLIAGIDSALSGLGIDESERLPARNELVEALRARKRAARSGEAVLRGSRIVVIGRGRAQLRTFETSPAPGEVAVRTLASAISSGTERAQWLRLQNAQPDPPYIPGYSACGVIIGDGDPQRGLDTGARVAVIRAPHSSILTVPADWATPVPPGVSAPAAALAYLAVISGYGVRRAELEEGAALCVVGAGPIGALAQRLALRHDPASITVVARGKGRREAALASGADRFLTAGSRQISSVAADVVIEATGDPTALASAVRAARPEGTVVLLGSPRGRTPSEILGVAQKRGLRLVGAHISALSTEARRQGTDPFLELVEEYLAGVADGSIGVGDLIGEALDPREPQHVYNRLARGELAAGHFDWSSLPQTEAAAGRSLTSPPRLPRRRSVVTPAPVGTAPDGEERMRFALVGCGDVGLHNARALDAATGAELATCHDPVAGLAEATTDRFGGLAVAELERALDPDLVDAVCLCVPHDLHTPLIELAAERGLQIVVEKPLAESLPSARRAVAAAEAAGVALSVCFPYRYERPVRLARELFTAGALGGLNGAAIKFHADKPDAYWVGGFSGRAHSDWRTDPQRSGGGVLIMNITHHIDFLHHITGAEALRLTARSRYGEGHAVEDEIAISAELEGGGLLSVTASAHTRGAPAGSFEIWGETGTVVIEPEPAIYSERAAGNLPTARWLRIEPGAERDPRTIYFERFASACATGEPVDIPARDGLAVQEFIEAAYRSAETGATVELASLRGEAMA